MIGLNIFPQRINVIFMTTFLSTFISDCYQDVRKVSTGITKSVYENISHPLMEILSGFCPAIEKSMRPKL